MNETKQEVMNNVGKVMATLYQGDCLEILPTLPAASVDCIIADPPYGTTACKWDSVISLEPMWKELKRIIKPRGAIVLFGSQPFTSALIMSNPSDFRYDYSWDKKNPKGYLNANKQPLRRHEDILIFGEGKLTYNPQMRKGVLRAKGGGNPLSNKGSYGFHLKPISINDDYHPTSILEITSANQREKQHPTQKPVALMEYLIKTYTNAGETVLDFTAGSGSTLVGAINTSRKAIGIEQDADYIAIAANRCKKAIESQAMSLWANEPQELEPSRQLELSS